MAGNNSQLLGRQLSFDDVKVGAADAACAHAQQHVPGPDSWICYIDNFQWTLSYRLRGGKNGGFHGKGNAVVIMPESQRPRHASGLQPDKIRFLSHPGHRCASETPPLRNQLEREYLEWAEMIGVPLLGVHA